MWFLPVSAVRQTKNVRSQERLDFHFESVGVHSIFNLISWNVRTISMRVDELTSVPNVVSLQKKTCFFKMLLIGWLKQYFRFSLLGEIIKYRFANDTHIKWWCVRNSYYKFIEYQIVVCVWITHTNKCKQTVRTGWAEDAVLAKRLLFNLSLFCLSLFCCQINWWPKNDQRQPINCVEWIITIAITMTMMMKSSKKGQKKHVRHFQWNNTRINVF